MPRSTILPTVLVAFIVLQTPASAQTPAQPADPGEVRRLTPEEKERILAQSDERTADAALASALGGGTGGDRAIHGEVGFEIGTGNTVGAFGTAMIPLGDRGAAILQFEDLRSNAGNFRRYRR